MLAKCYRSSKKEARTVREGFTEEGATKKQHLHHKK